MSGIALPHCMDKLHYIPVYELAFNCFLSPFLGL